MRPVSRHAVNKNRSAAQFRGQTRKTKRVNLMGPMRGGFRI